METYKRVMQGIAFVEKLVLAVSFVLVLALTFGNVVARYVFSHSWGFTEEIVVAMFVILSLLAAGVAAANGELVNLSLVTSAVPLSVKKVFKVVETVFCCAFSLILTWQGVDRMLTDHTFSPILHISKTVFWSFVVIGGISMTLHFIENCILFCVETKEDKA